MNEQQNSPQAKQDAKWGLIGQLWRSLMRPSRFYAVGTIGAFGILLGVLGWGGFNWAMELTNTETFCISCHEMRDNVYREYQKTIHYNNRSGVRAVCTDCHVPKDWLYKVVRKIRATNELYHHFMGSISTREKFEAKRLQLAQSVWQDMKSTDSRECRNCHSIEFMDLTKQENRSSRRHQDALKEGKTCIDCHKGVAHELPKGAFPGQRTLLEKDLPAAESTVRQSLLGFLKHR